MWRKAMIQLGLSDDEDLYPDDADPEPERSGGGDARQGAGRSRQQSSTAAPPVGVGRLPPPSPFGEESSAIGSVRPFNPRGEEAELEVSSLGQTVQPSGQTIRPRPQVVRPVAVTANARPQVVVADTFNQAQHVADKFKSGQAVIMNLQGADRELSRRLIDFASGLCYGLGGQMEKVANQVYLLTPANVEVPPDERQRLKDHGYEA